MKTKKNKKNKIFTKNSRVFVWNLVKTKKGSSRPFFGLHEIPDKERKTKKETKLALNHSVNLCCLKLTLLRLITRRHCLSRKTRKNYMSSKMVVVRAGSNLNFEFESAHELLINLNLNSTFAKSMNLNLNVYLIFAKSMNLNLNMNSVFSKSMNLNLNLVFSKSMNLNLNLAFLKSKNLSLNLNLKIKKK